MLTSVKDLDVPVLCKEWFAVNIIPSPTLMASLVPSASLCRIDWIFFRFSVLTASLRALLENFAIHFFLSLILALPKESGVRHICKVFWDASKGLPIKFIYVSNI